MGSGELVLEIEGMTCASCVGRVERAIERVPGVQSCSVNLATSQARVLAQRPDAQALILAVRKAGYEARLHDDRAEPVKRWGEGWLVIVSAALSIPLLVPMLLQPLGLHLMPSPLWQWLLATPVQFGLGWRFYRSAWSALRNASGNMDLLVALGTSAAYGLSVWLWAPWEATPGPGQSQAPPHLYFEGSAVVITLVLLGKWLEARAKRSTLAAIDALRALRPETAVVLVDGQAQERALSAVRIGDIVMVPPGQRIPVDGQVTQGRSHLDESAVTGESLPVAREPGDAVIGGTLNGEGMLLIRTTATGAETAISRIVRLIEQAQARKPPIQRTVDRISAIFVPAVVAVAIGTLLAWGLAAPGLGWEHAIIQAVSVLVIACPCALGLATPATLMVGTGVAARMGLLVRDAQALELLRDVEVMALDKTGTLTRGHPRLLSCVAAQDRCGPEQALALAAALQQGSGHPLARAVREAAQEKNLSVGACLEMELVPGRGVRGIVASGAQAGTGRGRPVLLGSVRWMREQGLDLTALEGAIEDRMSQGQTVSVLAEPGQALALLSFGDELRSEAAEALATLKRLGVRCVMISGDNQASARAVARELGIEDVRAPTLPDEKARVVQSLREMLSPGGRVAMLGDGVNDAPALAAADVGLAMPGTDAAMETAGLTLLHADLRLVPKAIALSRAVSRRVSQNLFWAFAFNVVGIPMAAFGMLSPVVAGAAMAASSVTVVTSALMLRRWQP